MSIIYMIFQRMIGDASLSSKSRKVGIDSKRVFGDGWMRLRVPTCRNSPVRLRREEMVTWWRIAHRNNLETSFCDIVVEQRWRFPVTVKFSFIPQDDVLTVGPLLVPYL